MAKRIKKEVGLHNQEVSTSELAAIIGKTPQWIRQLTRDGVLLQVGRGKYKLGDAVQEYLKHVTGTVEGGKISFSEEKAAHEQIKKEMALLELEEKRNNLHSTADIQEAWGALLVNFRERLTGLPPKLAGQLTYINDEKEIRRLLETRINESLFQLSEYDPSASVST